MLALTLLVLITKYIGSVDYVSASSSNPDKLSIGRLSGLHTSNTYTRNRWDLHHQLPVSLRPTPITPKLELRSILCTTLINPALHNLPSIHVPAIHRHSTGVKGANGILQQDKARCQCCIGLKLILRLLCLHAMVNGQLWFCSNK